MFVVENGADSYQTMSQGGCPPYRTADTERYVGYVRETLTSSLSTTIGLGTKNATDSAFVPACLSHCVPWGGEHAPRVGRRTSGEAFKAWYSAAAPSKLLIDARAELAPSCSVF
jgi:hypothetical protein